MITDVIIMNLKKSPRGLEQLYKALSGVRDELKFKPGDKVYADISYLHTWKFDKNKSLAAGLVINERMLSLVTAVDPEGHYIYEVTTEARDDSDKPIKVVSCINEKHLCIEEEWPGEKEDLPF